MNLAVARFYRLNYYLSPFAAVPANLRCILQIFVEFAAVRTFAS